MRNIGRDTLLLRVPASARQFRGGQIFVFVAPIDAVHFGWAAPFQFTAHSTVKLVSVSVRASFMGVELVVVSTGPHNRWSKLRVYHHALPLGFKVLFGPNTIAHLCPNWICVSPPDWDTFPEADIRAHTFVN